MHNIMVLSVLSILTYDSGDHDQRHVGALVSVKYGMFRDVDAGRWCPKADFLHFLLM